MLANVLSPTHRRRDHAGGAAIVRRGDHETLVIMAEIHTNRRGVEALNRVFDAHSNTITTPDPG
ncbi:MAG TPA: hypothetical protein VFY45_18410 [Baekduia sp.]|nr:hypothetical protein [Baekduia sp.]